MISIFSAIMAITLKDVQAIVSISAGVVAIVSGCFAIRYYHIQTKKIKKI